MTVMRRTAFAAMAVAVVGIVPVNNEGNRKNQEGYLVFVKELFHN